jgi:hypothetical protein
MARSVSTNALSPPSHQTYHRPLRPATLHSIEGGCLEPFCVWRRWLT